MIKTKRPLVDGANDTVLTGFFSLSTTDTLGNKVLLEKPGVGWAWMEGMSDREAIKAGLKAIVLGLNRLIRAAETAQQPRLVWMLTQTKTEAEGELQKFRN